jgi:beta-lactamase class A
MKRVLLLIYFFTLLLLSFLVGRWYEKVNGPTPVLKPVRLEHEANRFNLIDPLLMCESSPDRSDYQLKTLSVSVENLIRQEIAKGNASMVAVYFRELESGRWFGINENERFPAASLMKVPIMIAYLKLAENDPKILKKNLTFDGRKDWSVMQFTKPALRLEKGKSYSVEELIRRMIGYSDNNATYVLYYSIDSAYFDRVLNGLHIDNKIVEDQNVISLKEYTKLFRILYNATYLNEEMSQKAMEYLALKDFTSGISAGLPSGVVVTSKFGESRNDSTGKVTELQEVGIVHHEKHAYLIGIMTRGDDFEKMTSVLRDISKKIYILN